MRRLLLVCTLASPVLIAAPMPADAPPVPQHVAPTEPRSPEEERRSFRLPPGFEAQLVAAEPDIHKPLNLAFDDRGRLWVTETLEYPHAATSGKPRDAVKVLEDFGPDGRARKITTFADGLNIPIGVLPTEPRRALVFSIPHIYRLTDTTGSGWADQREIAYSKYGSRDTHGMTNAFSWGFDGWIYACHGFANRSDLRGADRSAVTLESGNVYRMRPDGSRLEQFTHGQVNPFGLAFDPYGDLFSADCHSKPIMMLQRGGWYQSFGKPHDGLGYAPEMCDHSHDSTALCGLVHYAAAHFPKAYRDTLFLGNVWTCRINHDTLEKHGSSYRAVARPDFLVSHDPWFRPVDLKLGPDGALYVADFYNRIIGHYEVPLDHPGRDRQRGRIWRIVYRGPEATEPLWAARAEPDKTTDAELIEELNHHNLAVRLQAANQLVARGPGVAEEVGKVLGCRDNPRPKPHALWVVERLGKLGGAGLAAAARDEAAVVRVHAMRVLAERREWTPALRQLAEEGLRDAEGLVRRTAAEALGQHPDVAHVRPLLDLRHAVPADDPQLLYAVRKALRNQLVEPAAWSRLPDGLSEKDAKALADVAPGAHHAGAAAYLLDHLCRRSVPIDVRVRYTHHAARYGASETGAALLTFVRGQTGLDEQAALFRAVVQGTQERGAAPSSESRSFADGLAGKLLAVGKEAQTATGIEMVSALKLSGHRAALVGLMKDRKASEGLRVAALNGVAALESGDAVAELAALLADGAEPVGVREQAANALARLNRPTGYASLLAVLPTAPVRLQTAVALGLARTAVGGEALLAAVAAGKVAPRLLQERAVALRLEEAKVPRLKERLAELTRGLPPADQRLQDRINARRGSFAAAKPDAGLGAKVYEKHCAACHQVGGKGAKVGPQLDGIGGRGLERLLEDVIDPNRVVDQAFRTTTLALKNGQLQSGLLLREEGEVYILADAQGKEVRVAKATVEERGASPLSPMPANLVEQIAEAEFHHLMAYLLEQRSQGR